MSLGVISGIADRACALVLALLLRGDGHRLETVLEAGGFLEREQRTRRELCSGTF